MTNQHRPNFFIVGAPKCGTTAWVEYLSRHPDIFFNEIKETHIFATDMPRYRAMQSLDEFLELFAGARDVCVLGDASPMHLLSHEAARNIKAFNPEAKILILLREIGSFVPSYHNQMLLNCDENNDDLAVAWAQSGPDRRVPSTCRDPKLIDYKSIGAFAVQVDRFLSTFSASQIRVAWMEDWRADPGEFHRFLLEFLGLRPNPIEEFAPVNTARRHRSRLLAGLLQDRRFVGPIIGALRRLGVGPLGIHTRLKQANMSEGYDTTAPDDLIAEIRAHYRDDAARLHTMLDGSDILYTPPLMP
jgi:hypothetical protein